MPDTNPFRLGGVIVCVKEPGVYVLALPNGHNLLGYVIRRDRGLTSDLGVGDRVEVEVSPCDLSKGRLRVKKEEEQ